MREFLNSFSKLEFDKVKKYIQRYSISDMGREHVANLFPSSDLNQIKNNLALVTEMKHLLEGDDPLPMENIFDIRTSLNRSSIEDYFLSAEELLKVELILKTSRMIQMYFSRRSRDYPLLFSKVKTIYIDKILEFNIERAIDEEGRVKDNASKELSSIRKQIIEKNRQLRKTLENILKTVTNKDWSQEEIITTREGRMVIPVKVEHKNHVPGFIHSASSSGATVYIEPSETLELNNGIRTLYIAEQREVEKILKDLTCQIREKRDSIFHNIQVLAELDFIQAKGKYSIDVIGSEPMMKSSGLLRVVDGYHPILLQVHGRKDVVPLNFEVDEDIHTVIITGPNAGGKSVTMKTLGLLSLLAQSGCHIPASSECELRIFTDIFVDMGDEQSIENDLSSFSSHLSNLKLILENANLSSLVLLDEIGSGTDPNEGASMAAAILERLTNIGSLNIATTHHGTLKAFAFETLHIENAAMEFDQDTLRPTYRFRLGIPGSSYAFEMANRLSMPQEIILRARGISGSESRKLEMLITDLERRSLELKNNLEKVNNEKISLDNLNLIYKNKVSSLEKELKEIKSRAIDEAKAIVSKANAIIEKSVKEIKEKSADRAAVIKAKTEIKKAVEEFESILEDVSAPVNCSELQIGDKVMFKQSKAIGEISAKLGDNCYLVLLGDLKIKINRKDIELTNVKVQKLEKVYTTSMASSKEIKREIDLRGMYGDEAIEAVDKFIDSTILYGLRRIDIIHGKGTGALRKKITEYLKQNTSVISFRLGEWNEGGEGVTIVELK